jgi:hypothetical protein
MGRGSLRSGVVMALVIVALAQAFGLLQGVRSLRRLQARVTEQAERRLELVRPRLDALLVGGGRQSWDAVAAQAIALGAAAEVEVLDAVGRPVYSRPAPSPVSHALRPEDRRLLAAGRSVTVVVQDGSLVRVFSYLPLPAEPPLVLRLAATAGDLEGELRERRQVFLASVLALAALAGALLFVVRAGDRPAAAADERDPAGAGGDGARGRADGRHRPRGAQRARHDRGLRAPARA